MRTAESHQQLCCQRFERLSDSAKQGKAQGVPSLGHGPVQRSLCSPFASPELIDFKSRRVSSFRKNLVELAELELKHAKVSLTPPALCKRVVVGSGHPEHHLRPQDGVFYLGHPLF